MHFLFDIDLQLFGEGGDGAGVTGSDAGSQTGDTAAAEAPAAGEQQTTSEPRNLEAEFDALIKGEFKQIYGKRVQDTVTKRLKGTTETVEKYNAVLPILEAVATKYGLDPNDHAGISRAVEEDNIYYEDEAMKRGVSVEQYKTLRRMERNAAAQMEAAKKAQAEAAAQQLYNQWMQEGEQVKAVYANFDLDTEMADPQFQALLKSGVNIKTAFEVLHKDELIPAVMQKTAQEVRQKLTNDIVARGRRPAENGLASTASVQAKLDPKKMTKKERQELAMRAARGERIEF